MTTKELRILAIKERATIHHTMKLSNEDSIGLAKVIYMTAGSRDVLPYHKPPKPYHEQMNFKVFCKRVATGEIPKGPDKFAFRGMKIEWFTGEKTRFIVPSLPIPTVESGIAQPKIDYKPEDKFSPQEKRNHCNEDNT